MLSTRVKEELTIQLVLLGLLILSLGAYLWLMLPRWKKELLVMEATKSFRESTGTMRDFLSGADELLIQEFKRMVSEWDHAQLQKFRKKMTPRKDNESGDLSESEPSGETTADN